VQTVKCALITAC